MLTCSSKTCFGYLTAHICSRTGLTSFCYIESNVDCGDVSKFNPWNSYLLSCFVLVFSFLQKANCKPSPGEVEIPRSLGQNDQPTQLALWVPGQGETLSSKAEERCPRSFCGLHIHAIKHICVHTHLHPNTRMPPSTSTHTHKHMKSNVWHWECSCGREEIMLKVISASDS